MRAREPYRAVSTESIIFFTAAKTANYATKEGLVEGVELMSASTASKLGEATAVSSLIAYGRVIGLPIGIGVRTFTNYYVDQFDGLKRMAG